MQSLFLLFCVCFFNKVKETGNFHQKENTIHQKKETGNCMTCQSA